MVSASTTMESSIPVSCSILYGIGILGLTKVENLSTTFLFCILTAPISMILSLTGERPVVSKSNTTYVSSNF